MRTSLARLGKASVNWLRFGARQDIIYRHLSKKPLLECSLKESQIRYGESNAPLCMLHHLLYLHMSYMIPLRRSMIGFKGNSLGNSIMKRKKVNSIVISWKAKTKMQGHFLFHCVLTEVLPNLL